MIWSRFKFMAVVALLVLGGPSWADLRCEFKVNPPAELSSELVRLSSRSDFPQIDRAAKEVLEHFARFEFGNLNRSIRRSGIIKRTVDLMRANSRGVIGARDLLKMQFPDEGYILGLTTINTFHVYANYGHVLRLYTWESGYFEFGIDWAALGHTNTFLNAITQTGKPIVFLIPDNLMSHPRADVTRAELEWFVARPERMRNVTFVFGAYDFVNPTLVRLHGQLRMNRTVIDEIILRSLRYWRSEALGAGG